MRTILLAALLLGLGSSSYAQYSARTLTRRIAPQVRPPPPTYQQQQQQQQPAPQQPPPQANPNYQQQQYQQYQYAATPARPVDPAKAAAEKAKNEEKQFEYFRKRAEEGSDHAQYELGVRYLAGKGVAPDEKLGREWLGKAAKNGNTQATKKLAELGGEGEKSEPTTLSAGAAAAPESAAKPAEPKPADQK
jgi:TPR repeat protein